MKVRAIGLRGHGGLEVLEDMEVELTDRVPAGHVRVHVDAVALNHLDLWVRRGLPGLRLPMPHRLGSDIAGTIGAVGEGVDASAGANILVSPGISCGVCELCLRGRDNACRRYQLLGENTNGGYAELLDVPAANILPWPHANGVALPVAEAAAIPLTFLTAWQMVHEKARVERDDTVLVHAAGAGVSVAAIQMCKAIGARVIATSTSAEKLSRARTLGADEIIDSSQQDFVAEVKRLTGKRGVEVVIDHVGGEVHAKSLLALANGGRLVTCGATAGFTPQIDLRHVFFRQLAILGSTMGSKGSLFAVLREVERGSLRPIVDRVLPFTAEGAREGHRALEARAVFGKVVLVR